jgi:hypothetical protein
MQSWLAETEVAGEHRFALVFAREAQVAKAQGARVLEQPLRELVEVKPAVFKGFSNRGEG